MITVAGTGVQGHELEGGRPGREQPLSSPWDVALGKSAGKAENVSFNNLDCVQKCILLFLVAFLFLVQYIRIQ